MKQYVLAFAHRIPHASTNDVVLVQRTKNDWQNGRLNLPGGAIEPGESPVEAAVRELREETGLVASLADTRVLGTMECGGSGWRVHVCFCPYRDWYAGGPNEPKTITETDPVVVLHWRDAMNDPRLIPNLRILIPFCQARLTGWSMYGTGDHLEWTTHLHEVA